MNKIFITTVRIFRNTFQHLARNPSHTLAAVLAMSLTFFVVGIFTLVMVGSNELIKYLETRPQLLAFFKDEATEEHILQLRSELEKNPQIEKVSFVGKEQALEIYKKQNLNVPQLLEFVTAEILPASLEISVKDLSVLPKIAHALNQDSLIEEVIYQKEVVAKLQDWTQKARQIGLGLIGILVVVSVLTVLIVISGGIASFGKEIEIMKLVGASSWYVRWPFLLDGAIFGIVSASLSTGILLLLLPQIKGVTAGLVPGVDLLPVESGLLLNIWLTTMLGGASLGVVGSFIAMWKHLRV